jgi:hypothetical protein
MTDYEESKKFSDIGMRVMEFRNTEFIEDLVKVQNA